MNREALIRTYADGPARLKETLESLPREMWDYKPSPTAWSVREIIIHMPDSEASGYVRCRKIIAQNGVSVDTYDQDAWASRLGYQSADIEAALELFRLMRIATVNLIKTVAESSWANCVHHPDDGKMTLDIWLEAYAHHVTKHCEQMRRNMAVWEAAGRPSNTATGSRDRGSI
ncbi:MAG: DinB family protein [candidate division Zixibacteria bacterium]|nr:DinB family protein [candidate division Zixibacteria bacterium]